MVTQFFEVEYNHWERACYILYEPNCEPNYHTDHIELPYGFCGPT